MKLSIDELKKIIKEQVEEIRTVHGAGSLEREHKDNKALLRSALSELLSAQGKIFDAQAIEMDSGRRRALSVLSLLLDKAIGKLATEPLRDGLGWKKS